MYLYVFWVLDEDLVLLGSPVGTFLLFLVHHLLLVRGLWGPDNRGNVALFELDMINKESRKPLNILHPGLRSEDPFGVFVFFFSEIKFVRSVFFGGSGTGGTYLVLARKPPIPTFLRSRYRFFRSTIKPLSCNKQTVSL